LLIGYSSYLSWHKHQYIEYFVMHLEKQPGLQIIHSQLTDDEFQITFLRSPLAQSVAAIRQNFSYPGLTLQLNPKVALIESPEYFLAPIASKYGVTLNWSSVDEQPKLIVNGQLTQIQIEKLKQDPIVTSVFKDVDTQNVEILTPLSIAQQSRDRFNALVLKVNSTSIFFESASVTMTPGSAQELNQTINDIREALSLQQTSGLSVLQIGITGYADYQGANLNNMKLSEERAKLIADNLAANQIDSDLVISWGVGNKGLESIESANHRRVDLKIVVKDLSGESK
ncbi:MAG: OmpA family protein, partial [Kangiellaceae bacterium]|nr:OmpA family protein [Kangiellaceae bacterium]